MWGGFITMNSLPSSLYSSNIHQYWHKIGALQSFAVKGMLATTMHAMVFEALRFGTGFTD